MRQRWLWIIRASDLTVRGEGSGIGFLRMVMMEAGLLRVMRAVGQDTVTLEIMQIPGLGPSFFSLKSEYV